VAPEPPLIERVLIHPCPRNIDHWSNEVSDIVTGSFFSALKPQWWIVVVQSSLDIMAVKQLCPYYFLDVDAWIDGDIQSKNMESWLSFGSSSCFISQPAAVWNDSLTRLFEHEHERKTLFQWWKDHPCIPIISFIPRHELSSQWHKMPQLAKKHIQLISLHTKYQDNKGCWMTLGKTDIIHILLRWKGIFNLDDVSRGLYHSTALYHIWKWSILHHHDNYQNHLFLIRLLQTRDTFSPSYLQFFKSAMVWLGLPEKKIFQYERKAMLNAAKNLPSTTEQDAKRGAVDIRSWTWEDKVQHINLDYLLASQEPTELSNVPYDPIVNYTHTPNNADLEQAWRAKTQRHAFMRI
jgi:hypothetical protein